MGDSFDAVHRPSHYCHGGFETKDIVKAVLQDASDKLDGPCAWWYGNAMKYLFRWPFKGSDQVSMLRDLNKAQECIEQLKDCFASSVVRDAFNNRKAMEVDDED